LAFPDLSLPRRLLAKYFRRNPAPAGRSWYHRVSFLAVCSFSSWSVLPKMRTMCQENERREFPQKLWIETQAFSRLASRGRRPVERIVAWHVLRRGQQIGSIDC